MRAMVGWSVTGRLASILCPTLIIAADHDYSPLSVKEAYTAKIPGAQLVTIPDSRHATPVEHPQEFNLILKNFLAKHP
jgi:3-oxoadipate enol-lactonase